VVLVVGREREPLDHLAVSGFARDEYRAVLRTLQQPGMCVEVQAGLRLFRAVAGNAVLIEHRLDHIRKGPFVGDRAHLHYRLLDVGLSHRQAVLMLYLISLSFGFTAVFCLGAWVGVTKLAYHVPQPGTLDFSLFWDAYGKLQQNFYDPSKITNQKIVYGAIAGMANSIGDPYTDFFNPVQAQKFQQDLSGSFEGIGAEIGMKKDILTIIAPLKNTPAANAGLKSGDEIIGNRVKAKIVKNKVAAPFKTAEFDIYYNEGISKVGDALRVAIDRGLIKQSGSYFSYNGEKMGQGTEGAKTYLKEHPEVVKAIKDEVMKGELVVIKKAKEY